MAYRDIRLETAKGVSRVSFESLIIYEDEFLLAVNKPAGVSSLSERTAPDSGLLLFAREYCETLRLCHRLDKMTTGVLLFAKTAAAYRGVALQFQRRQTVKIYHALTVGVHHFEELEISAPLAPGPRNTVRIDRIAGKKALTIVNTYKPFRHYTLVECKPVSGRPHQIRVHLASARAPIVGDLLYGGTDLLLSQLKRRYNEGKHEEHPLNDEFLLHAHKLSFTHPITQQNVALEAPYPKNFAVCLKLLEKFDT